MNASRGRVRVLVVDDEPSICKVLTIVLERAGFAAVAIENPELAELYLYRTPVDVMIVDLRMSEMRGDIFFHHAQGIQPHLRTQTLFCTGDITEPGAALIAQCGCPLLLKPFDLDDLLNAVRALVPFAQSATA